GNSEFSIGGAFTLPERSSTHLQFFLDLLACLPEEEIRRNSRAKDRHQGHQVLVVETDDWYQSRLDDLAPIRSGKKRGGDISKQSQGQPLENSQNQRIGAEDLNNNNEGGDG